MKPHCIVPPRLLAIPFLLDHIPCWFFLEYISITYPLLWLRIVEMSIPPATWNHPRFSRGSSNRLSDSNLVRVRAAETWSKQWTLGPGTRQNERPELLAFNIVLHIWLHIYIYDYIYMTNIYIYIHIHIYMYLYVCIYVYIHIYIWIYLHIVHTYVYLYIRICYFQPFFQAHWGHQAAKNFCEVIRHPILMNFVPGQAILTSTWMAVQSQNYQNMVFWDAHHVHLKEELVFPASTLP